MLVLGALVLLFAGFLMGGGQARADDTQAGEQTPAAPPFQPTSILGALPTGLPAGNGTSEPQPAVPTVTPEPPRPTNTPLRLADTATPTAHVAVSPPTATSSGVFSGQAAPPLETSIVPLPPPMPEVDPPTSITLPTSTHTSTSTPTRTPTRTRTSTPSPSATSSWLPPGPDCSVRPGKAVLKLNVPYVHQVNDVNGADGNWACGPTSVLMVLAYYGKLEPWPQYEAEHKGSVAPTVAPKSVQAPSTRKGGSEDDDARVNLAPYLTRAYSYNGYDFSATSQDPRGNKVAGLYGTIDPGGTADWGRMKQVFGLYGLTTSYVTPTWGGVVAALKRGHPVLLGNDLTAAGHILVAVGYTSNNQLIVNDPYGNRFLAGYGANNGEGVYYPWSCSRVRNALEVIGTYPPPSPTPSATPSPVPTATSVPASAVLRADSTGPGSFMAAPPRPAAGAVVPMPERSTVMEHAALAIADAARAEGSTHANIPDRSGGSPPAEASNQAGSSKVLGAYKGVTSPSYWWFALPTLFALAGVGTVVRDRGRRGGRSLSPLAVALLSLLRR